MRCLGVPAWNVLPPRVTAIEDEKVTEKKIERLNLETNEL